MIYLRQGLVAESSRDAEFSLDNTLFRFGTRCDVAIVEPNQIKKFAAQSPPVPKGRDLGGAWLVGL